MKRQEEYRSDIEYVDKDHSASLFMALCEMNEVYSEREYYLFVANVLNIENELDRPNEAQVEAIIQQQLNEVDVWYEKQLTKDNDGNKVPNEYWTRLASEGNPAHKLLKTEYEKRKQEAGGSENREKIIKDLRKNEIVNRWNYIGLKKVYDIGFKYQSTWTYNDVLNYFRKNGFPIKRKTVVDELDSGLNVCKVRHILRNDILIEEAILLPLLEMQERKDEIKKIKDDKEFWQAFMIVVSFIITIATAPFTGGQSGWLLALSIAGTVASVASSIVAIVNMILDSINEAELKETTQRTNDLMLKNMPKSGNFVDTAITDPYSMYANGRLWKQGGAGRDRYDQMLPHEPYRALDDDFKDSDMFDTLNNNSDKLAGGDQYLSNLYSDGKWVNPSSLKALLNGAIPIYLSIRNKVTEAIFKWLTKNDLGTYYLFEDDPDSGGMFSKQRYWDRYYRIEFEDEDSVKGFTNIVAIYYIHKMVDLYDSTREYMGKIEVTERVGCAYSVSTKWDKDDNDKTQTKWNNITDHARVVFERKETKVLKGSEIDLYTILPRLWGLLEDSHDLDFFFNMDGDNIKNADRTLDSNTYYECEYELWTYGGKEVKLYKSIKEVKDYKEGQTSLNYGETLDIRNGKVHTYKCFKYFVRGEAKARIRFKRGQVPIRFTSNYFNKEELGTPCVPYIDKGNVYRYFDRNTRFAFSTFYIAGFYNGMKGFIACADYDGSEFIEVTIFHKRKDGKDTKYLSGNRVNGTTYFGISPFLNARRNITMF